MSEILEQLEGVPVEADNTADGSNLGKFASVEGLLKSYESLQSEFTRKSQILAELQQSNASVAVMEKADVEKSAPISREEIIRDYLTSVAAKQTAPAVITASNDFAFGATTEPKSIRDAAKVAEQFFGGKS